MIERLKEQLKRDEGVIPHAYQDSEGWLTIGVGRLIDIRKGGRLRPSEIDFMLHNDIDEFVLDLRRHLPWFDRLNEARRGVLVNMAFNLGLTGLLGFKQTLAHVERGEYEKAATAMLDSKWAKQVKGRADRLAEQMRSGVWQ